MKFVKELPISFFREDSGNEPVRKWLFTLTQEERRIIGRDIRIIQLEWPIGTPQDNPIRVANRNSASKKHKRRSLGNQK